MSLQIRFAASLTPSRGEGWEEIAERLALIEVNVDVATLQSWNLHLAMRPPPIVLTPIDIIFVEPPRSDV